jgi:uncharacterized protein (DUF1810 family)
MMTDRYNLRRFVEAQQGVYQRAVSELRGGRKESHWMWFIFPQIQGLGHSAMAQRYAISSIGEAREYLEHPLLGDRLRECTRLVTEIEDRPIEEIFGYPDYLKFHSSMTLFARAAGDRNAFTAALAKYFGSEMDPKTLERLGGAGPSTGGD